MNLAFSSFEPITTKSGINVLDVADPKLYFDLIRGFKDEVDTLHLSDDDWKLMVTNKISYWLGDPMLDLDLNKIFMKKILGRFSELIGDDWAKLADEARMLNTHILEESYLLDIPLEVAPVMNVESVLKNSGLLLSLETLSDPYAKMEALIKVTSEINEERVLVLTNVSHYLNVTQLCQLEKVVTDAGTQLLLIEFSNCNRRDFFKDCCYTYIDEDFVDWRE